MDRRQTSRVALSAAQIVDIAGDGRTFNTRVQAESKFVSKRTVTRSMSSTAYAQQLTQSLLMQMILEDADSHPPWWVTVTPQWDETRERLRFTFDGKTLAQAVEVMIFRVTVAWG